MQHGFIFQTGVNLLTLYYVSLLPNLICNMQMVAIQKIFLNLPAILEKTTVCWRPRLWRRMLF